MVICSWCGSDQASESVNTVHWELPDGTQSITITETPCVACQECGIQYQTDMIVKEIEDQLFLISTTELGRELSYKELMEIPRLLKRNYFDFS